MEKYVSALGGLNPAQQAMLAEPIQKYQDGRLSEVGLLEWCALSIKHLPKIFEPQPEAPAPLNKHLNAKTIWAKVISDAVMDGSVSELIALDVMEFAQSLILDAPIFSVAPKLSPQVVEFLNSFFEAVSTDQYALMVALQEMWAWVKAQH